MAMSDVLALTVPALLAGVGLYGALTGTDVFSALTAGALDGLRTVVRIFPALVALLAAVSMLRASGALDALTRLCAPVLAWLGIPPETAILMVVRPVSGSGALAAASDIIGAYGPDSRIGRTAAVMLGSTETTFYVLAVYFGACGVRRSRWTIPAAIAADLTGFLAAAALVRWIWGA
ncbi:MAG: spore maturation protein [Oscillospiraceae bacterium]